MIKNFRDFIKENLEEPGWSSLPNYNSTQRGDLTFSDNTLSIEQFHLLKRGKVDSELRDTIYSLVDSGVNLPIFFNIIGTEMEGALFIEPNGDIFYTAY